MSGPGEIDIGKSDIRYGIRALDEQGDVVKERPKKRKEGSSSSPQSGFQPVLLDHKSHDRIFGDLPSLPMSLYSFLEVEIGYDVP